MGIQEILKQYWGYDTFRPLQQDIINTVISGNDALALMPTGGGKSLCFQVPALYKEGICIVVSPLIALMKDQVEGLKAKGIQAVSIVSGMGKREVDICLDNCVFGKIKFLYLSPERLLSELVRERIRHMNVSLVAIDEAHCISQWGYDFRPPYLKLADLRELLPNVPFLALTATATEKVRTDIINKLKLINPKTFQQSFERKNLSYVVAKEDDKYRKLLDIASKVKGTGIVYVRNRRTTAEIARFLNANGIRADFYHAGLDAATRSARQNDWKNDVTRVIVATNAFGMGIDKPNVRFVVHLHFPESMEAYYQEAGRAGRDGKRSYAVLLADNSDTFKFEQKIADSFPTLDEIKKVYHYLGNYYQLAFGAGEGLALDFDIGDFCTRFKVEALKTLHALKYLEHDEYIAISESVYLPSRVQFQVSHEDLYRFQIENVYYDPLIKALLRSYGGMYDAYTKIKESDLAKRLHIPTEKVREQLTKLEQYELLSYIPQTDKPQLQYTKPRQELANLIIDTKYVKERQQTIVDQLRSVIHYVNEHTCRSNMILQYFGEVSSHTCGVCDVCIAKKRAKEAPAINDRISVDILNALYKGHMGLDELMLGVTEGNDHEKLEMIRLLLDAGKIKTDGKKYYI